MHLVRSEESQISILWELVHIPTAEISRIAYFDTVGTCAHSDHRDKQNRRLRYCGNLCTFRPERPAESQSSILWELVHIPTGEISRIADFDTVGTRAHSDRREKQNRRLRYCGNLCTFRPQRSAESQTSILWGPVHIPTGETSRIAYFDTVRTRAHSDRRDQQPDSDTVTAATGGGSPGFREPLCSCCGVSL